MNFCSIVLKMTFTLNFKRGRLRRFQRAGYYVWYYVWHYVWYYVWYYVSAVCDIELWLNGYIFTHCYYYYYYYYYYYVQLFFNTRVHVMYLFSINFIAIFTDCVLYSVYVVCVSLGADSF